jgi:SPP1 gp7 family putative phage head morphogenesis protein
MLNVKPLPPEKALEYWTQRIPITADDFSSLEKQARNRAWTVQGLAKQELVSDVFRSMQQALEEGLSIQEWRKRARNILSADGDTPAALLKKHRLDVIYRTNMQTAYQAGRWQQIQEGEGRQYLRYSAVRDRRTRPQHAALHGKVYPADHEFWDQYYPPNGFNCRCTTSVLSEELVQGYGYEVEKNLPGPTEWVDPQTGEVKTVNPAPDPGFGNNPGKDFLTGLSPRELDAEIAPIAGDVLCKDGEGLFAGECWLGLDQIEPRHIFQFTKDDLLRPGMDDLSYIKAFVSEFGANYGQSKLIRVPGVNLPLVVSDRLFLDKKTTGWKVQKRGREKYLRLMARTIQNPFEVWQSTGRIIKGDKSVPVSFISMLRLFKGEGQDVGGFSIFRYIGGSQWQGVTVFPSDKNKAGLFNYLESQRKEMFKNGVLLYRER